MNTVVIVGAGNIGSRHLQAFINSTLSIQLYVVDPSDAALQAASLLWTTSGGDGHTTIKPVFVDSFNALPDHLDVVIIATNSKIRKEVYESIALGRTIKHVVFEKFLFQCLSDYTSVAEQLKQNNSTGWVNCPRRMYPAYSLVKEKLKYELSFDCRVIGSNWGLGCNSIHFLDLFSYLSGKSDFFTSSALLDSTIQLSKRDGYIEFTGTVVGKDIDNNVFAFSSVQKDQVPITITLLTPNYIIKIEEKGSNSSIHIISTDSKESEVITFAMPYQSQLSHLFVESLLQTNKCALSTYTESSNLHISLLNAFIERLQTTTQDTITSCPIT
ncbi:MAG: Gfo/Idh/MocA family oxidoreductase [Cytophagaceae bacterium]|jgi:predicted dehydrogenase|nr:Gfo/Idh/MocA family oxidoreductase [Cytophagaceae bacterium]